jgi:hypothetical protein
MGGKASGTRVESWNYPYCWSAKLHTCLKGFTSNQRHASIMFALFTLLACLKYAHGHSEDIANLHVGDIVIQPALIFEMSY